jgi:hypothetical protein
MLMGHDMTAPGANEPEREPRCALCNLTPSEGGGLSIVHRQPSQNGTLRGRPSAQQMARWAVDRAYRDASNMLLLCPTCHRNLDEERLSFESLPAGLDAPAGAVAPDEIFSLLPPVEELLQLAGRMNRAPCDADLVLVFDTAVLVVQIKHWGQLATRADQRSAHPAARRAWVAAVQARTVFLSSDSAVTFDARVEAVKEFAATWLGWRYCSDAKTEAVIGALLSDDWLPLENADNDEVRTMLKALAGQHHLTWRPTREGQINGMPITSLSAEIFRDDQQLTLADTLAVPSTPVGWANPRISRIMNNLSPTEQDVLITKADGPKGLTWKAAAELCGQSAKYGDERVRRKVARLVKRYEQRERARRGDQGA